MGLFRCRILPPLGEVISLTLVQTGNKALSVLGLQKKAFFFVWPCLCAKAALPAAFLPARRWFSSGPSALGAR